MANVFDGNGRRITLEEDSVIITRKGVMGSIGQSADMTIPLDTIQTVVYRKGSIFANGFLQFGTMGGQSDATTVYFYPGSNDEALEFKNLVEKSAKEYRQKSKTNGATVIQQVSVADEIRKMKELLDSGIITKEEFDAKKKQLLGF